MPYVTTPTVVPNFRNGRHPARPRQWRGIVLHWTAGNGGAQAAVDFTGRPDSGGWYNFVVEKAASFMCVDPSRHRGAHAGSPWNRSYIGIASAQPIYPGRGVDGRFTLENYRTRLEAICAAWRAKGYDIGLIDYPSRSTPLVLSLDAEHAEQLVRLCSDLCERHGIRRQVFLTPKHSALSKESPEGVVFHHQISTNGKWDCIPWLPVFRQAFTAAGFTIID